MHRLAKQGMALVVGAAVSLCPGLALSKESAINSAPSYIIRGDTISVDAVAIGEQLTEQKPLTLLIYQLQSRRWIPVGSSHFEHPTSFTKVTGPRVLFTYTDSGSLNPGSAWFGITRKCTANGICPLDVEPDEGIRVIIAQ